MPNTKIAFFSAKEYDKNYFRRASNRLPLEVEFMDVPLNERTVKLAAEFDIVCVFVNDQVNGKVVKELEKLGVKLVALRCAGFNNVDIEQCANSDIAVVRVPEYSPFAVAEHTFGLILTLNRKIHKAFNRVREGNFALDGLLGFDLNRKTIGIFGCGKIGRQVAKIAAGFGMQVLIVDPAETDEMKSLGTLVERNQALEAADIVTLHCPLNDDTYHLIDDDALSRMKLGAMLVNTSRGALLHTSAVFESLKTCRLGALAIDVYEEEADLFFSDHSETVLQDDVFARLLTFPNVLVTGHQAFLTHEALEQIANTTIQNCMAIREGREPKHQVWPAFA